MRGADSYNENLFTTVAPGGVRPGEPPAAPNPRVGQRRAAWHEREAEHTDSRSLLRRRRLQAYLWSCPRVGIFAIAPALDHVGPIAWSVADIIAIQRVLDPRTRHAFAGITAAFVGR